MTQHLYIHRRKHERMVDWCLTKNAYNNMTDEYHDYWQKIIILPDQIIMMVIRESMPEAKERYKIRPADWKLVLEE